MSEQFKIEKVILNLPEEMTPNTVYIVRVGAGYEMYVTDMTGTIAHTMNMNNSEFEQLNNKVGESSLPQIESFTQIGWLITAYESLSTEHPNRIPKYGDINKQTVAPFQFLSPEHFDPAITGGLLNARCIILCEEGTNSTVILENFTTFGPVNILINKQSVFSAIEPGVYNVTLEFDVDALNILDVLTFGTGFTYSNDIQPQVSMMLGFEIINDRIIMNEINKSNTTISNQQKSLTLISGLTNSLSLDMNALKKNWLNFLTFGTVTPNIIPQSLNARFTRLELANSSGVIYMRGAFKFNTTNEITNATKLCTITSNSYKPVSFGEGKFLNIINLPTSSGVLQLGFKYVGTDCSLYLLNTPENLSAEEREATYFIYEVPIGIAP